MENDVILVGGSKDGLVTAAESGMGAVHNIVLNEAKDGPEYVDRYVPTSIQDRNGNLIYVHVGRYNATESQSYWDQLDKTEVDRIIAADREEEARQAEEAAAKAAEEEAASEESTEETKEEPVEEVKEESTETATEEVENADQG